MDRRNFIKNAFACVAASQIPLVCYADSLSSVLGAVRAELQFSVQYDIRRICWLCLWEGDIGGIRYYVATYTDDVSRANLRMLHESAEMAFLRRYQRNETH